MSDYKRGGSHDLDLAEVVFLVFSGIFVLLYVTNSYFNFYVYSFYIFFLYSFKKYPTVVILYLINLFMLITGIHGLYVRVFETRLTGSKLKLHSKLERYRGDKS